MTTIQFHSHGFTLSGNFFPAANPKPLAFLFIQGWMGHQNVRAAQNLASLGFTSLTYDMRGNGQSEGDIADFTRADFIADAVTAYDELRSRVGEGVDIAVVGSSFGSYTAVLLTAKRPVHALSLRVPAPYPDEGFDSQPLIQLAHTDVLRKWREAPTNYMHNMAFKALHDFTGKIQIVEAGADEQVCHQAVQNYIDAVSDPGKLDYHVLKDAPHSLVTEELRAEYNRLLRTWAVSLV